MSEPEQVSKAMMDELNSLRHNFKLKKSGTIVGLMNDVLEEEHLNEHLANLVHPHIFEQAIIDYVVWNEDVFEEDKPKKYIVRSKNKDKEGDYWYITDSDFGVYIFTAGSALRLIKFDTREEAEKWTNPQTEVVEVEE